ncbi:hypothetical protein POM88_047296 [Heracleum sosnowskyi]|uniref:Uncharacterized protein n=1 Tax=Heracleum sosnowskyi TaxID=360622 RepID=A0AAD8GTU6_9APIA|nr:hypothetical protein POM88_047296 [Heracleum sosnowskyi]
MEQTNKSRFLIGASSHYDTDFSSKVDSTIFHTVQNNVDEAVEKLKAQGVEALGLVCHVSNARQRKNLVDTTVQKYGKIDVVVSNVATSPSTRSILDAVTKTALLGLTKGFNFGFPGLPQIGFKAFSIGFEGLDF